jgi:hypothetical protein
VAGEPQLQIDIHKAVSILFFLLLFFLSFDETRTELGLDAEGLTETVLHLNLGFLCFLLLFVYFVVSPLMRQQQNFFPDTNTRTGR